MTRIPWLLACLAGAALPAEADRITFKDGGVCEGRVVQEMETGVTLEVVLNGKTIRVTVSRDRIARREKTVSILDQYAARLRKTDRIDPDALAELARWCIEQKLVDKATVHLKAALLTDPDHALSGRLALSLGFVQEGPRWLTEEEHKRSQGLVRYKGRWVSAEEADRLRRQDAAAVKDAERRKILDGIAWHVKRNRTKLARAREVLLEANRAVEVVETRIRQLESEQKEAADRRDAARNRQQSIRSEIVRIEALLIHAGERDRSRLALQLDPLYRNLSDARRDERDAERRLGRLAGDLRAQQLALQARKRDQDLAQQTVDFYQAEVDRLLDKRKALDT